MLRSVQIIGNHASLIPHTNGTRDDSAHPRTSTTVAKQEHQVAHDGFPDSRRPSKRRKLEIRGPRQQTLDSFFSSNPSRPPVSIATSAPNGHLVETINGVRKDLTVTAEDVLEDDTIASIETPQAAKRLKIAQAQKQEDKRSLRSQDDGPRLRSDLATYFSNYEEIIFDTPKKTELINVDTKIFITDDTSAKTLTPSPSKKETSRTGRHVSPSTPRNTQAQMLDLDLSPMMRSLPDVVEDPLSDAAFMISHRRAERKEKQMRNIERARAMHEKAQLEKLLDGLLGHDWLRVLGITGVTDSEAKKFEPKRDYFITEVQALVDKFNAWKEEEKRQKYERDAILAAERDAADDSTEVSSNDLTSSDLNLSASRQLQQEAARSFAALKPKKRERKSVMPPSPVPYRPPSPIKSFYPSRHLRDSALKKTRNSRNLTAFGLPIPDLEERDFALPADYLTADVLRASARDRRRKNREIAAKAATKP